MKIRPCEPEDYSGVDTLLKSAFPEPGEARLAVALRAADADTLELVAELDGRIVGVAMFSPALANLADGRDVPGLGLGPVAVLPDYQNRGIGGALIEAGLDYVRTLGPSYCIVLGDPDFYSRFGFEPAPPYGFEMPGPLKAGWLQVRDLKAGALDALPRKGTRPIRPWRWVRGAGDVTALRAAG